jgi:hypothetical protein
MSYILTNQKIAEKLKDKEWHRSHILSFVSLDSKRTESQRREIQLKCYHAYTCYHNAQHEKNTKPITNPYGLSLGMQWIVYPLVESKMEQMVGEYMTRGIKRKTYVINKKAQTAKLNEMFDMISEEILRETNKEVGEQLGFDVETASPDKELPPDVEEFFEQGYKTISEQVSDTILNQVLIGKKQIDKIKDLYLDFLLYDECIGYIDEEDSQPSIRRCDIFETELDYNPDKEIQDNPQYLIFNKILGYNTIINSYDLNKEEETILSSYMNKSRGTHRSNEGELSDNSGEDTNYSNWLSGDKDDMQIRCVEMIWISQKKISVKVSLNKKSGKEIYKAIADDYKPRKGDNVKSIWVQQKRKCVMAGPDLILEWGTDNERYSRIDNPKEDCISVVAIRRNNSLNATHVRSAASKLLELQEFASECLFELRLAMRRNNGRVLVYDAAQIPKQFLKTGGYQNAINRVMHHAKKDQFLIINSADKTSRNAFNQFSSLDLSTKGMMQDLFNVLALIEELAGKFLGLSPEREGQVDQYQSATGTERAVTQSTARTEVYVKPFESFVKFLLDKVLMKGKYCYEENEMTQYLFGDIKTKFFKVYPEYFQEDVGVYIADNFAEQKKKAVVDQAAQQALSNAATPDLILSLIETLNADTAGESEAIFKRAVKSMNALKEQEQQAAQASQEAALKANAEIKAEEMALKREGFQNNIDVAIIQSNGAADRESRKNETQSTMKLADIEKDLMLAEQKKKQINSTFVKRNTI